jgi:hypothetical protein
MGLEQQQSGSACEVYLSVDPVPFGHWTLRDDAVQRP